MWGGGHPSELWAQMNSQSRDPALLLLSFLSCSEVAHGAGGVGTWRVWNLSGLGIVTSLGIQIKVLSVVRKTFGKGRLQRF